MSAVSAAAAFATLRGFQTAVFVLLFVCNGALATCWQTAECLPRGYAAEVLPASQLNLLKLRGGSGTGAPKEVAEDLVTLSGGCHCKALRFEVDTVPNLTVLDCNCSVCWMRRNTHFVVNSKKFRLTAGGEGDQITTYRFNTGKAQHMFCRTCGISPFYTPRSNPDDYGINVWCIDEPSDNQPQWRIEKTLEFDGKNWEKNIKESGIQEMGKE